MTRTARKVGIDLQENEENRLLIEAIEADNQELTIRRLPGLVKLSAPAEIVINRTSVEGLLGRPWDTGEFQMAIVSLAGNVAEWDDDQIVIRWNH